MRPARAARIIWKKMSFQKKIDTRKYVESHGVDIRYRAKCCAADATRRLCSTVWRINTKVLTMMIDLNNHTIWQHRWRWHNRGCVWYKIASEWSGAVEWSEERKKCQNAVDKCDFVTLAVTSVKHSVAHILQIGESIKPNKERKEPRTLDPSHLNCPSHRRYHGTYVRRQQCGRKMDQWALRDGKHTRKHGACSEDAAFMMEEKTYPVRMINDCVKHMFREHNQDADHLTNLGTEGEEYRGLESSTWLLGG